MRKVLLGLAAVAAVAMASGIASAQCQGGVCGFGGHVRQAPRAAGRFVYRGTVRVTERARTAVGRTRLFDGDGRPFRKAS